MTTTRFNIYVWGRQLFILLVSILLISCQAFQPNPTKLAGTRWTLQSLDGHGVLANTAITLKFDAEQLYGSTGCNSYGTEYALQSGSVFTVGEGQVTQVGCRPDVIMQQESEYLSVFWKVTSYKIEDKTLFLTNEQGKVLQYKRLPTFQVNPKDLVGKTWQLVSATSLEEPGLSAFTLRFDGHGISGRTNCNEYTGDYQTSGDSLRITFTGTGVDVPCSGEKDQIAEATYNSFLEDVWQYNVSQTQLELYTDKNEKLVFKLAGQK